MTYIPEALRQQVSKRAGGRCEYCLIDERYVLKSHEVDHIRAEKHGGETILENLCLSCFDYYRHKGSDLSSVDPITDDVAPLFHPRRDEWHEHFRLSAAGTIEGISPTGRATVRLLNFNHRERVEIRVALIALGRWPSQPDEK